MGRNYSQKILKMIVFVIGKKTFPRIQKKKKKTLETIKEELINFLKYIDDEDEHQLEEMVGHIKNAEEADGNFRSYEEILKTKNVKIINIAGIQGQLLK